MIYLCSLDVKYIEAILRCCLSPWNSRSVGFSKHWKQGTWGAVPWNILKQGGMEGGAPYIGTWNTETLKQGR